MEERVPYFGAFFSSWGNGVDWLLMGLSSLAQPILATLILAAIVILLRRIFRWRWHITTIDMLLTPLIILAIAYGLAQLVATQAPLRTPQTALRIAHLNALFYNRDATEKYLFTEHSNADVVSLVEANGNLATNLTSTGLYPYHARTKPQARPDNLPMLLLSRWPIQKVQSWSPRLMLYRIDHPTTPFYVLQMHIKSPYPAAELTRRNADLARIDPTSLPSPLIVVGDFNTVPWDPALKPYRAALTQAASYAPTFPSILPLTPIDHLFTKNFPQARTTRIRVLGTDHLGLIADFPSFPIQ